MTAATSTTIAQPGKAASAYERMRARTPRERAPSARVRTRQVGVTIGGFGFTYTAKDLEVGHEVPLQHAAATLGVTSGIPEPKGTPRRPLTPDQSLMTRKRGTTAYAAQLRRNQEDAVPRSVLLSVV